MDPRWIRKIYTNTNGEDFLGLRLVDANISAYLIPGVITITPRARYYAFYSWLLTEYSIDHPKGWSLARFIKRREQIYSLSNLIFSFPGEFDLGTTGLFGTRVLNRVLQEYINSKSLPLSNDNYINASYGGFDAYTGVMRAVRLFKFSEIDPDQYEILPAGKQLAEKYSQSISDTVYYKNRQMYDTAKNIPKTVLLDYGDKCHLSNINESEQHAIAEKLFCFDVKGSLPDINRGTPASENMRATLGLILDMVSQTDELLDLFSFRKNCFFGACPDYPVFQPKEELRPVLYHWQMRELRELYIYALHVFWGEFLNWLHNHSPSSLEDYISDLENNLNFDKDSQLYDLQLPEKRIGDWRLDELLESILSECQITGKDLNDRCRLFSDKYNLKINEFKIIDQLMADNLDMNSRLANAWLLLACVFFRLKGFYSQDRANSWYWAEDGSSRRRSMNLFMEEIDRYVSNKLSMSEVITRIYQDYIISQHVISALEKWQQRSANTFHFTYDNGQFEWVSSDDEGFTGSRFPNAFNILLDLGLIAKNDDKYDLSSSGKAIFSQVLQSFHE